MNIFSSNNSCIDLIFSESFCIELHGTLHVNLSDREMIYVTCKHVKILKHPSAFIGCSYMNYKGEVFSCDAPVFNAVKPNCEKYKNNVFYKGAFLWKDLSAKTRNIEHISFHSQASTSATQG